MELDLHSVNLSVKPMELDRHSMELDFHLIEFNFHPMEFDFHLPKLSVKLLELQCKLMVLLYQLRKIATGQTNASIRWWAIENKSTIAAHWQGKNQIQPCQRAASSKHQPHIFNDATI